MTTVMTFNGYRFNDRFEAFCASRPLPEFRDESSAVSGLDGEYFDGWTLGTREFEIILKALDVRERRLQSAARELMGVLAVRSPKAFTFSDERDRDGNQLTRYAVPSGAADVQEFVRAGQWRIRFIQPDPHLYGKQRSVFLRAGQWQRVSAGGNCEAWPEALVPPGLLVGASYYTLKDGDGRQVTYYGRFTAHSSLRLYADEQRVRVDPPSSTDGGLATYSRFFPLDGSMSLYSNATTELSWTERWL